MKGITAECGWQRIDWMPPVRIREIARGRSAACGTEMKMTDSAMESSSQLMWGVLFGAIGLGYFAYGKKQRAGIPLFCGIALCLFPYVISNVYILVIIGAVLAALPFILK